MIGGSRATLLALLLGTLVAPQLAWSEVVDLDGPAPRIVNGINTHGFPSTGALLFGGNPSSASSQCSGTMIGCETFLTAAHCVEDSLNPANYTVFLQHGGFFSVTSIEMHPSYSFPVADVAVLKLGAPMVGIAPTPIDTTGGHALGTAATIAGFGRSGGIANDYGVKRHGAVELANCLFGVSNTTSICWSFDNPVGPAGQDSNTCNGDSGGPLFIDDGSGLVVAGVTSGGNSSDCLAFDSSFDTRVSFYAPFIESEGGADLASTSCGALPHVGDPDVEVFGFEGTLNGAAQQQLHSFDVDPGSMLLRITMNANDDGISDFDFYARAGLPPSTTIYDCAASSANQFGACDFEDPSGGPWYVLVDRFSGAGTYQITATSFGTFCSDPGNEGLACDDANACTESDICAAGSCVGSPVADGTGCDDGNSCSAPDTCVAGVCVGQSTCGDGEIQVSCEECDDGGTVAGDGCDASCSRERCYDCVGEPSVCGPPSTCSEAARSILVLKSPGAADRVRWSWKWLKGSVSASAFGDPLNEEGFDLCLWQGGQLVAKAGAPEGGTCGTRPCWRATGPQWAPTGYKYKNKSSNGEGVKLIKLKEGVGSARLLWKSKGANLTLPTPVSSVKFFSPADVLVQAVRRDGAMCWEAQFDAADVNKNDGQTFKAVK